MTPRTAPRCLWLLVALVTVRAAAAPAGPGSSAPELAAPTGDWRYYAADAGVDQVQPARADRSSNVARLGSPGVGPRSTMSSRAPTDRCAPRTCRDHADRDRRHALRRHRARRRRRDRRRYRQDQVGVEPVRADHEDRPRSMGFSINRGLGSWRGRRRDRLFLVSHGNLVSLDAGAASRSPPSATPARSISARWVRAASRTARTSGPRRRSCAATSCVVGNSTTDP